MCTYICTLLCHKSTDHIEIQCENICLSMVLGQLATYMEKIYKLWPLPETILFKMDLKCEKA